MMCLRDLYVVPDRHIRYATTKSFFGTKMGEGSSVHDHCVQMLSFVEKLEDLKAGIENDTYIDVFLQSLPPSYGPFIVNFNINGLEKFILKFINMLVQFEAMFKRSEPVVMLGEASTSREGPTLEEEEEQFQRSSPCEQTSYQGPDYWQRVKEGGS
ncbi:UNVERIFIED_CONTAM: hypothetical protein Slati_1685600 [Sesamum latifolium]|uniref:Retrovirus-related Pol polyprotein from transposon TNT 1-94 n=1 Tax=Sesamum latifolium TaxID=2727402 RepID=A0AAW2WYY5_9LAMI